MAGSPPRRPGWRGGPVRPGAGWRSRPPCARPCRTSPGPTSSPRSPRSWSTTARCASRSAGPCRRLLGAGGGPPRRGRGSWQVATFSTSRPPWPAVRALSTGRPSDIVDGRPDEQARPPSRHGAGGRRTDMNDNTVAITGRVGTAPRLRTAKTRPGRQRVPTGPHPPLPGPRERGLGGRPDHVGHGRLLAFTGPQRGQVRRRRRPGDGARQARLRPVGRLRRGSALGGEDRRGRGRLRSERRDRHSTIPVGPGRQRPSTTSRRPSSPPRAPPRRRRTGPTPAGGRLLGSAARTPANRTCPTTSRTTRTCRPRAPSPYRRQHPYRSDGGRAWPVGVWPVGCGRIGGCLVTRPPWAWPSG